MLAIVGCLVWSAFDWVCSAGKDQIVIASAATTALVALILAACLVGAVKTECRRLRYL